MAGVKITDKAEYMREYRKGYRRTPEGRAKILAARKRWKKSENGKKANREWAKKKYVAHPLTLKTPEQIGERRWKYYHVTEKPKRQRRWRDKMEHLKRYGITKDGFHAMMAEQGGGCAICGGDNRDLKNRPILYVDHCHDTGKIRGLLCDRCNRGIGCLKEDETVLTRALAYLRRSRDG